MGQECSCLSARRRKASRYGRRVSDDDELAEYDDDDHDDDDPHHHHLNQTIDILIDAEPMTPDHVQREQQMGLLNSLNAQERHQWEREERLVVERESLLSLGSSSVETTRLSMEESILGSSSMDSASVGTNAIKRNVSSAKLGSPPDQMTAQFVLKSLDPLQPEPTVHTAAQAPMPAAAQTPDNLQALHLYEQQTGIVFTPKGDELDLECIMCLDTFGQDNPKVRTLCNCGMNRTNFHMSCLLEWLQRDANCPVCRAYLFYED